MEAQISWDTLNCWCAAPPSGHMLAEISLRFLQVLLPGFMKQRRDGSDWSSLEEDLLTSAGTAHHTTALNKTDPDRTSLHVYQSFHLWGWWRRRWRTRPSLKEPSWHQNSLGICSAWASSVSNFKESTAVSWTPMTSCLSLAGGKLWWKPAKEDL